MSPDTCESFDFVIPFQHFGGYYYDDVVVRAFTHVHMQGSGAVDLGAVGAMPYTGALDAASIDPIGEGFRQTMNKATEQATPGYYAVRLANDVDVELSATPLCGHHRITFGAAAPAQALLVLPSITIAGERGHLNVSLTLDAARGTASGVVQVDESLSSRQTDGLPIYFWMALRLPSGVAVGSVGTWRGATLTPNATQSSATRGIATGFVRRFGVWRLTTCPFDCPPAATFSLSASRAARRSPSSSSSGSA